MTSIPKFDETRNIRDIKRLDDSELRESMDKWGWLPQFPAYADENGVLLVGHRRMKLAKEFPELPLLSPGIAVLRRSKVKLPAEVFLLLVFSISI